MARQKIDCCEDCKPPKRNAYCHTYCPEYKEQRAEPDAVRNERNRQQLLDSNINGQLISGVNRANRKRRS